MPAVDFNCESITRYAIRYFCSFTGVRGFSGLSRCRVRKYIGESSSCCICPLLPFPALLQSSRGR